MMRQQRHAVPQQEGREPVKLRAKAKGGCLVDAQLETHTFGDPLASGAVAERFIVVREGDCTSLLDPPSALRDYHLVWATEEERRALWEAGFLWDEGPA
jgi:hypothetical protein